MKKGEVLVIGGAGFIGRNLIETLLIENYSISVLDIVKPLWLPAQVEFIEASFESEHLLDSTVSGIDYIYHLASTTLPKTSNDDPVFDITSNLVGTVKLLEIASLHKIKKFVFVSSGGTIYGVPKQLPIKETSATNPICSYGIVKLAIEKYLRLYHQMHGLNYCCIRLANPYGEYQRVDRAHGAISVFCYKALKNETIQIWGDGSIARDFIYITDVISALLKALNQECKNEEINIGSGEATSLNELVKTIEQITDKTLQVEYLPSRSFDVPEIYLDIAKAKRILDWNPETQLIYGIEKTINWILKNNK